jgi:hypothetical protein
VGWHKHKTVWPIESLTVAENYGTSVPWVALKITDADGNNSISVCSLDIVSKDPAYLDSSVRQHSNTPTTTVTGLDHLIGQEVEILAEGATHAVATVDYKGEVELSEAAQIVDVGLPFTAKLVTQPAALMTKEGALKYQLGRWNEMYVYLLDSALPLIDGLRAEEHEATSRMGYKQSLYTGYTNSMQTGWERDTVITVEQDLPYPLVISHIAGELEK